MTTSLAMMSWACSEAASREAPAEGAETVATEAPETAATGEVASTQGNPSTSGAEGGIVPSGTVLTFTVDEDISTDSYEAGHFFLAALTEPVLDSRGDLAIDAETPAEWRVTGSAAEDGQPRLAVALESIEVDGEWLPVAAALTTEGVGATLPAGSQLTVRLEESLELR